MPLTIKDLIEIQRRKRAEIYGDHDETLFEQADDAVVRDTEEADRRFRKTVIARPGEWEVT